MAYTVKQLADLAGVSVRTLHYDDQIDLLRPTATRRNGYRSYGQPAVMRLQQILFYKELGLSLDEIKAVMDRPDFDVLRALESHHRELQAQLGRTQRLLETVEHTIAHLKGDTPMTAKQLFAGFSDEEQERYERQAQELWGDTVTESAQRWKRYSADQKAQILSEAGAIYDDFVAHLDQPAASPAVQAIVGRWHQNLRHFYEPTPQILRGLGQAYSGMPEFAATFDRLDPRLAPFLTAAIEAYCDWLA